MTSGTRPEDSEGLVATPPAAGPSGDKSVKSKTLISIIVPVFNEDDNVLSAYNELKDATSKYGLDYDFEFLFTDNRSTDETFDRLRAIAASDRSVRIARFSRNFGFQKSVLTGYRLARGAAAIQIDADLQDPPALIGPFLEKWRDGYDVVVGVRRRRQENWLLTKARRGYYRLLARLGGAHLLADAGDFRLIDRSVIEKLRRIGDPHIYLRGLISSLARRQHGIPYDRAIRKHNDSKFRLGSLVRLATDGILAHSSLPLRVAFYLGLLVACGALLLAGFYLLVRLLLDPSAVPAGFTTTQLLVLFGIGLNSIFLGVIGIYVGRIYDQVRPRPTTIISDLINFDEEIEEVERKLF